MAQQQDSHACKRVMLFCNNRCTACATQQEVGFVRWDHASKNLTVCFSNRRGFLSCWSGVSRPDLHSRHDWDERCSALSSSGALFVILLKCIALSWPQALFLVGALNQDVGLVVHSEFTDGRLCQKHSMLTISARPASVDAGVQSRVCAALFDNNQHSYQP